jgi:hypothetical protein
MMSAVVETPDQNEAQENFRHEGLGGLLPQKRGPKKARKLTPEVRLYLEELVASEPELKSSVLAARARSRFDIVLRARGLPEAGYRGESRPRLHRDGTGSVASGT